MSCPNATAPIDISISNITGNCDLKCAYDFNYNNSSCVAKNVGDYISLSYDKNSSPPVTYNASGYYVQEIRIYCPSLHSYNGQKADGGFIIIHNSTSGNIPLLVCIPIQSNSLMNNSSNFFETLVNTMSSNAPSEGEETIVNIDNFNLSNFVPRKPFFSYTATQPYQPCVDIVNYIVFEPSQSSLSITPDILTKLKKINFFFNLSLN